MVIKILFLVVFFAMMIGIGFYCKNSTKDVDGFLLGGRGVGPWLTAFAYGTSYFSAVIFIGYAGQFGWKYGIAATWIGLGNTFIGSLFAWNILGRRTRVMTQSLHCATMPEFFGKRYDSKSLKLVSSIIIFVFLIPYTASLYNGLSRLFTMAFGIPYTYCIIAMSILTGIYVIVGGYMATAINNFIQGLIMLVGIVAVIVAVLKGQGGFTNAITTLSQQSLDGNAQQGVFTSFFGPDLWNLVGVVILTSLGTWGLPQMVQKFYSITDQRAIKKGTIISTVFALIVAGGCYFLGGFGRLFADKIEFSANGTPVYDSIIPTMLSGLPDILIGLVVILVLSASMSTLSSLVLTSGSTITIDFIEPITKKKMAENKKMLIIRIFIVVFIVISAVLAIIQANSSVTFIAQLMGISWGALAGAFLAPFLYGLYFKGTTKAGVWAGMLVGVGIMIANVTCSLTHTQFINAYFSSPINAGVLSMLSGLIIVPLVSLFTPKMDKKLVNNIFECYNEKITVSKKNSLED